MMISLYGTREEALAELDREIARAVTNPEDDWEYNQLMEHRQWCVERWDASDRRLGLGRYAPTWRAREIAVVVGFALLLALVAWGVIAAQ